jgi:NADPH-dependent FMN reductase
VNRGQQHTALLARDLRFEARNRASLSSACGIGGSPASVADRRCDLSCSPVRAGLPLPAGNRNGWSHERSLVSVTCSISSISPCCRGLPHGRSPLAAPASRALKNASDWASRPWVKNSFHHIPAGVIGASVGSVGTAVAQQSLRAVLSFCNARQMTAPEAYIHFTKEVFADDGEIHNEATNKFLTAFLEEFRDHVVRVLTVLPRQAEEVGPQAGSLVD